MVTRQDMQFGLLNIPFRADGKNNNILETMVLKNFGFTGQPKKLQCTKVLWGSKEKSQNSFGGVKEFFVDCDFFVS
jgi:hypothetical protein